jgi:hypothetical protein
MKNKILKEHKFYFNNGKYGTGLCLKTIFVAEGEEEDKITKTKGIFIHQILTLESYANSASFELCGTILTSTDLRKLADQLDAERAKLVN